jgi:hypothetical protein
MTRLPLLFLPFLLTACPATGDDSKATDDTGPGTGDTSCGVTIDETIPSSGATDADYRAAIEFHLSDADSTATATSSIAGTTQLSDDSETVYFIPNEPLEPSTSYTVTLNYCGGSADLSFTTSSLGTPLSDPSILVGKTYSLDLAGARIVEPDGIGSVLTSYLTQVILVGVTSVDGSSIEMMGAIGAEGSDPPTQDTCTETIDFPTADFSDQPFFTVGPQDTTLSVAGYDITIGELNITAAIGAISRHSPTTRRSWRRSAIRQSCP